MLWYYFYKSWLYLCVFLSHHFLSISRAKRHIISKTATRVYKSLGKSFLTRKQNLLTNSRSAYQVFWCNRVEELQRLKFGAISKISQLPYSGIKSRIWKKFQTLLMDPLSTPRGRNWAYFCSTCSCFRDPANFQFTYLGMVFTLLAAIFMI